LVSTFKEVYLNKILRIFRVIGTR